MQPRNLAERKVKGALRAKREIPFKKKRSKAHRLWIRFKKGAQNADGVSWLQIKLVEAKSKHFSIIEVKQLWQFTRNYFFFFFALYLDKSKL